MYWIWVSLPYATYALTVQDWHVTDAPPIAWWTIGKDVREVLSYLNYRHAELRVMKDEEADA